MTTPNDNGTPTPMPTDPNAISAMVNPPAAPATPAAPTAPVTATPSATNTPATPAPQPRTKQEWFNHLLGKLAPPQNVVTTNPDGTQTVENKATPISLAHIVLTSALAGAFGTKNTYRDTPYGPVLDRQATTADAFNKGQQIGKDYSQAAQKAQDDLMARKLSTVANNVAAVHSFAQMQQAQFAAQKEGVEAEAAQDKIWQASADQNNLTTLASADSYDQSLTDKNSPRARLAKNQTYDELMNSPFKSNMTSQLMIMDGMRPEFDEHLGRTKMVPTYSVLNPAVTVKLNEDTVARMNKFNPTFGNDLFAKTTGGPAVPLNQLAQLTHQASSLSHAEAMLQSLSDSKDDLASKLGITGGIEGRLSAAARKDSAVLRTLTTDYENAGAHGGNTADKLQRILQSGGGDAIFEALGTDRDKVTDFIEAYNNRIVSARKLAEQGGMGEKAPMAQPQVKALIDSIKNNPNLEASDKTNLLADVPAADKDGNVHMAQGQGEKLTARLDSTVASNKGIAERNLLAQGDPVQLQKTASNIIEGDVNQITKISSLRGNARTNLVNALHDEANERKLDTTQYTQTALDNKAATQQDYSGNKKGSTGAQIASFNTLVGHIQEAATLTKKLEGKTIGLTRSPWMNTASDTIAKQFANDPDWTAYKASLIPVQNEYANLLAAGYSPKEEDAAMIRQVMDPHETPARVMAALKQLATTADVRLSNMGQRYLDTMQTTNTNLLTADSRNTFKNLGIPSKTDAVSQPIPRGWQGGTATRINPATLQTIFVAAGRDPVKAGQVAKANGWLRPDGTSY
jgi:hypothetical protein